MKVSPWQQLRITSVSEVTNWIERENRDNYLADNRGDEERVVRTRPVAFLPRPCISPCLLPLLVNTPEGNQKQP
jgi:hypothetical protein